jgi:hypothetical protein
MPSGRKTFGRQTYCRQAFDRQAFDRLTFVWYNLSPSGRIIWSKVDGSASLFVRSGGEMSFGEMLFGQKTRDLKRLLLFQDNGPRMNAAAATHKLANRKIPTQRKPRLSAKRRPAECLSQFMSVLLN